MGYLFLYKMYVVCLCIILTVSGANSEKLLMFMLGGCRNLYLKDYIDDLPGFKHFFAIGSRAEHVDPQFPTMTFPNHYSLVTGLYPENHGFVGNFMWDKTKNESFDMTPSPQGSKSHWWEDGEPIWVTAGKQGKRTYLYNWLGCQVKIRGRTPSHCHQYSDTPKVRDGMAGFLWQSNEAVDALINDKADLAGVYTQIVDQAASQFTTNGEELKGVLKWIDNELQRIYYRLEDAGMLDAINIVIFSDRGVTEVTPKRTIHLQKYINNNDYDIIKEFGPKVSIWPKEDNVEMVYQKLKHAHPNMTVYKKEEIPDDWHHKGHRRVAPIIAVAELGWMIVTPEKPFPVGEDGWEYVAYHGFDPTDPQMKAMFVGVGPNFKKDVVAPSFSNVNLYQLMCRILRIKPAPNDGTWGAVQMMYQDTPEWSFWNAKIYIAIIAAICIVATGLKTIHRRRTFKYL
ncbi:glycerophosphocholine cholinephosphodiesterase ENPP6-like [Gigantopelta aegis]|uniref:glycerophosphocholine cholinephosphodiesterase ENPP6-like n=1 Tax=Gigantopelta aegis TaxID=1735272 RepID=UPI001B88E578|nr:glycerophosphocholine cholinephosphodiesterase ENPP6-like [Gigantopelta aegis]